MYKRIPMTHSVLTKTIKCSFLLILSLTLSFSPPSFAAKRHPSTLATNDASTATNTTSTTATTPASATNPSPKRYKYASDSDQESEEDHPTIEGREVSLDEAKKLFKEFQNSKTIPFKFSVGDCDARAHQACHELYEKGIRTGKAWLIGQNANLTPKKGPRRYWNFHVAPVVYVRSEPTQPTTEPTEEPTEPTPMVIDPSLAEAPVSVQEWENLMKVAPGTRCRKAVIGPRYTFDKRELYCWEFDNTFRPEKADLIDALGCSKATNEFNMHRFNEFGNQDEDSGDEHTGLLGL